MRTAHGKEASEYQISEWMQKIWILEYTALVVLAAQDRSRVSSESILAGLERHRTIGTVEMKFLGL